MILIWRVLQQGFQNWKSLDPEHSVGLYYEKLCFKQLWSNLKKIFISPKTPSTNGPWCVWSFWISLTPCALAPQSYFKIIDVKKKKKSYFLAVQCMYSAILQHTSSQISSFQNWQVDIHTPFTPWLKNWRTKLVSNLPLCFCSVFLISCSTIVPHFVVVVVVFCVCLSE